MTEEPEPAGDDLPIAGEDEGLPGPTPPGDE
jgi:hypothetical protein